MSKATGEEDTTGDVATGVTWSDIYESPQVDRSLRRLPRLCREAVRLLWAAGRRELLVVLAIKVVNGLGLAAVLLLGKACWTRSSPPAAAAPAPGRSCQGCSC